MPCLAISSALATAGTANHGKTGMPTCISLSGSGRCCDEEDHRGQRRMKLPDGLAADYELAHGQGLAHGDHMLFFVSLIVLATQKL